MHANATFFSGFSWKNLARRTLTNTLPHALDQTRLTAGLMRRVRVKSSALIIPSHVAARPSLLESLAYLLRAERADAVEPETEDEMILVA